MSLVALVSTRVDHAITSNLIIGPGKTLSKALLGEKCRSFPKAPNAKLQNPLPKNHENPNLNNPKPKMILAAQKKLQTLNTPNPGNLKTPKTLTKP